MRMVDETAMTRARGASQGALDALMLTDAPLIYSPSLVALAALIAAIPNVQMQSFPALVKPAT